MIKSIYSNEHKQVVQCKNTFLYTSVAVPWSVGRKSCTWYIDAGLCVVSLTAGALDPMCVWQLWHPTNAVYWDFIYWLYRRFCGPSQFAVRKHWYLPSLKTAPQMATHFFLSKVISTWGLSKCQCSSKCHSKKATVIPPCLHLNIYELQVDCWWFCMKKCSSLCFHEVPAEGYMLSYTCTSGWEVPIIEIVS